MKSISKTYRIISILLALLVLVSSVGFTANMHYCKGKLKSFSLLGKAKTCHEAKPMTMMPNCPHHKKMMEEQAACSEKEKDCCDSKFQYFQSDTDKQIGSAQLEISVPIQQFILASVITFFSALEFTDKQDLNFAYHSPPIIVRDTYALLQRYLI